ncbi:CLUMA_CG019964, isoform A [Clunio marinus]|uniref:CLUMA_CG019964, isoform A n=1 Tax=Clunio marinus TaxID=568069 RepID=A0A1J1J3C7_9DIPT|nr:CLUMA_CG019964, isoform A [Clunio marinus]
MLTISAFHGALKTSMTEKEKLKLNMSPMSSIDEFLLALSERERIEITFTQVAEFVFCFLWKDLDSAI